MKLDALDPNHRELQVNNIIAHDYVVQSLLIVAIHGVRPPGELGPASP